MLAFDLVVRTPGGAVRSLRVQANDADSARVQALRDGHDVLRCTARAPKVTSRVRVAAGGVNASDVATLAHDLAALLASGLSIVESLRTLAANEKVNARRATLLGVVKSLSEGLPLSTALARDPGRFPPLLIATVSASEQTGDLSTALSRYAEHQQRLRALRDKIVGAAVYPMLLLALGSLVVIFLLGVVVPKFALLIESARRELPWSSQLLMSWGRLVADHAPGVGAAASAAVLATALGVRHLVRTGAKARWVESVPVLGPTIRLFRHAQLYRTTGMLVRGGIAAPRALHLASNLLGNDDRARLAQAVTWIHEGRSASSALLDAGLADPVAASMLTVAERTGALAEILERIAAFHEVRLQRAVELTSRLFEPLLMVAIGLVIGAIVVLMYLPIFDLASSLQ